MKRYLIILTAMTIAASMAMAAGDGKKAGAKKVPAGGKEMTFKGKVMEFDRQVGSSKKKGAMQKSFYLFQADGFKMKLPDTNESVNLEELAGKNVEIVVVGSDSDKSGIRVVNVAKIISAKIIDEGAAASTNAPADAAKAPAEVRNP